jgi:hypothetical protein
LKTKDSSGHDGVSTQVLKMYNALIGKPLSYICNKSIQSGVFPDFSLVKPLFKNGDRTSISNYRHFFFTSFFEDIKKDYIQ